MGDTLTNIISAKKTIAKVLEIDEGEILPESRLTDLEAGEFDVMQIFNSLGILYREFTCGGKIIPKGREELKNIQRYMANRVSAKRYTHLGKLADSSSVMEFIGRLTVQDIIDMVIYINKS